MLDDVVQRLQRLVGFPTVGAEANGAIVDWVRDDVGGDASLVRTVSAGNPALQSVWMRFGPAAPGGVLLSGHLDVVPAGEGWTDDPWRLTDRDDRVYGRGTCDMKGFIACALTLASAWCGQDLSAPIYLAFSSDEETGSTRMPAFLDDMTAHGVSPDLVVIGEPTDMRIVRGHKGTFGARTRVRGRAAHSADPRKGRNANVAAARLLLFFEELQREWAADPESAWPFDPPYTTVNPGVLRGGTGRNVVAESCDIEWDGRLMPGQEPGDILRRVAAFCESELGRPGEDVDCNTEQLTYMPPLEPSEGCPTLEILDGLCRPAETPYVSWATEGGFFQRLGWPTVICGPGSIDEAHRPDESVSLGQLSACLDMLQALPDALAGHRDRAASGALAS